MQVRLYDPATQTEYFGDVDALVELGDGLQFASGELTLKLKFATPLHADSGGVYIGAGEIQNGHIQDSAIGSAKIATNAVTSAKIATWAVTAGKILPGSVGEDELAAGSVTSVKLALNSVGSAQIASDAVTNFEISDNAITTLKVADQQITVAKLTTDARPRALIELVPALSNSAVALNLALGAFSAVSDPSLRRMCDLRGMTTLRMQGRIGGSLVAATKIRLQYHIGGNVNVATGDGGWTDFPTDSAGSHTLNQMFYTGDIAVPSAARINHCLVRAGLFSGDGGADPMITCCILNVYP